MLKPLLKVLIPDLPTADELLPHLRRIDFNKQYSNGGPLLKHLESRLGGVCVANATLGIELAAPLIFKGKVRIPAFTFPATATALIRAGLEPVLCDVSEDSWTLDNLDKHTMPVATFGVHVYGWFIDAAGAWGNHLTGPRVYSLHATKVLPAGEGGVICGPPAMLDEIRERINFGFRDGLVTSCGTNAKMSEYHAAVGLVSLDRYPRLRKRRQELEARYRKNLKGITMQVRPVGDYSIFPVLVPNAEQVKAKLAKLGIETRRWYIPTLDRHPAFAHLEKEPLPFCDRLNEELLCLPFHTFLTDGDVDRVCESLFSVLVGLRKNSSATSKVSRTSITKSSVL